MLFLGTNPSFLEKCKEKIFHFHISEKYLDKIDSENKDFHKLCAYYLKKINYSNWISIEMKQTSADPKQNLDNIVSSVKFVKSVYY